MTKEAYEKIAEGLCEAIAYAKRDDSLPPLMCIGRCETYGDCIRRPRCERDPDAKRRHTT